MMMLMMTKTTIMIMVTMKMNDDDDDDVIILMIMMAWHALFEFFSRKTMMPWHARSSELPGNFELSTRECSQNLFLTRQRVALEERR